MRAFIGLTFVLFINGVADAGEFHEIEVNKENQIQRSKDYFAVEVANGAYDCVAFTIRVKANPEDKQVRSSLASLEVVEEGKRVAWIPIDRQDRPDGDGHVVTFQLAPDWIPKSTLVLVHLTGEISGNVYRIDLASYTLDATQSIPKEP